MHLVTEREMRGGISMVSKRQAKVNNQLVEGYNPAEPTNYITYLDANNLYRWAMSLPLPKRGFHWKRVMPTEEQIMKMKRNSKKGWLLEVDVEYPQRDAGFTQQLSTGAGKDSDKARADVRISKEANE